jgi:serine protease Do
MARPRPSRSKGYLVLAWFILISGIMQQSGMAQEMMGVTFRHGTDQHMELDVLRGSQHLCFDVVPAQEPHQVDQLADITDARTSLIRRLGILAVPLDSETAALAGGLRRSSGVIVAARVENPLGIDTGLQAGDAIYEINRSPVTSIDTLQSEVRRLKPGDPVALFIERAGKFQYVAFEM